MLHYQELNEQGVAMRLSQEAWFLAGDVRVDCAPLQAEGVTIAGVSGADIHAKLVLLSETLSSLNTRLFNLGFRG